MKKETPAGYDPNEVSRFFDELGIEEWNRLDNVWALWNDEPAFADYVRSEIEQMLTTPDEQTDDAPGDEPEDFPGPDDIPVPIDIPVPQ